MFYGELEILINNEGLESSMVTGINGQPQQQMHLPGGGGSCLVAIGRLQVASMPTCVELVTPSFQFMSRLTKDGKFTFVDNRCHL